MVAFLCLWHSNTTDAKAEAACGEWIAALTERPRDKETDSPRRRLRSPHRGTELQGFFARAWANRAPDD